MAKIRTDFITNSSSSSYILVIGKETSRHLAEKTQTMLPKYVLTGEELLERYAEKVNFYKELFGQRKRLLESSDIDRDKLYFYLFDYDCLIDGARYECGKYRDEDGNYLDSMRDDVDCNKAGECWGCEHSAWARFTKEQDSRVNALIAEVSGFEIAQYWGAGRD